MWWALPGSNWFSSNSWCDSRTQGLRQTVSQYRLDSLGRLWAIDNGKQQSTLFNSICNLQYMFNINTWLMTNHTQNGPQKSWQVETPSRVGKSRRYSYFLMFLSCISWMTARCTMLASGGLPSNREIAHVCAWYASSFPAWKRTYHDLPWLTDCSLQGGARLKRQNQYFEVVGSSSSVPLGRNGFDACFELLVHLNLAARGLAHWRRSRCIGFWGTKWHMKAKVLHPARVLSSSFIW